MKPKEEREMNLAKIFKCLLGQDDETGLWVAHCLDFDLATSGKTEDEVWKRLLRVVKMHVEHSYAQRPIGLTHKADPDQWELFEKLKRLRKEPIRTEKISLTLIPNPSKDKEEFFWIQGIDAVSSSSVPAIH
jgi:hypothetical protein